MNDNTNFKAMQKRGQAEIIGSLILIGLLVIGGLGSYRIITENRYVGDANTMLVYDLKFCDINEVPNAKFKSFSNIDEAHKEGYNDAPCNR